MPRLELTKFFNINLPYYEVILKPAFYAYHVTLIALLSWNTYTAITVRSVIALNYIGMNVSCRGFYKGVEVLSVLIPFWNYKGVYPTSKRGTIINVFEMIKASVFVYVVFCNICF